MNFSFILANHVINIDIPKGYDDKFPLENFNGFITQTRNATAWLKIHIFSYRDVLEHKKKMQILSEFDYPILDIIQAREKHLKPSQNEQIYLAPNQLVTFNSVDKTLEVFVLASNAVREFFLPYIFFFASHLLAYESGLIIHGAGFEIEGYGAAFIGPSGAGKSTATSLVSTNFLLSDDVIAVTDINNNPIIHSTPLGGKNDGVRQALLRAFFLPKKSESFKVIELSSRQSFLRFLSEHNDYIRKFFKPCIAKIFHSGHQLFSKIPTFEIEFTKDYINKSAIRKILES